MKDYTTVYIGMDVHKENFTLCCYTIESEKCAHLQKIASDYKLVLKYVERMRTFYGDHAEFVCGYEAGCLGYTLYHQLTTHNIKCIILAPTTMMSERGKKKLKTDRKDAELIAKCLAYHTYSPVYVPSEQDEQVKEYIRMRHDHKMALAKVKQQIISFCTRHNYVFTGTRHNWTRDHIRWLRSLRPEGLYHEILTEYLNTLEVLNQKVERIDQRIEELAGQTEYKEEVRKLSCFIGIRTQAALSIIVETGDFKRFSHAEQFASYVGLVPGEDSSGEEVKRLGITKAGNGQMRRLLVEAAQCYNRSLPSYKSKTLIEKQKGNAPDVIAYADKANVRLRKKYYRMVLNQNKKSNVAKTAVARELACFIWGMMTGNIV